jgi:hypothetical protein
MAKNSEVMKVEALELEHSIMFFKIEE